MLNTVELKHRPPNGPMPIRTQKPASDTFQRPAPTGVRSFAVNQPGVGMRIPVVILVKLLPVYRW